MRPTLFLDTVYIVTELAVRNFMSHDVSQLIIVHRIKCTLIDAHDAAKAHERIDVFLRGYVDLIIPLERSRVADSLIDILHTCICRRILIDARFLLAFIQKLKLIMIIHARIIIGNKEHSCRSIENLLCYGSRLNFEGSCECACCADCCQSRSRHFSLPVFHDAPPYL